MFRYRIFFEGFFKVFFEGFLGRYRHVLFGGCFERFFKSLFRFLFFKRIGKFRFERFFEGLFRYLCKSRLGLLCKSLFESCVSFRD